MNPKTMEGLCRDWLFKDRPELTIRKGKEYYQMENFAKYIGIQGVLALLITVAVIVMVFMQMEVPKELWTPLGISWGFYYARNGGNVVSRIRGK